MEYFVLQRNEKLKKDQPYYAIPGLVDVYMNKLALLQPTQVSVQNRLLEWLIPNNQYNQSWISQHYPTFKILKSGEEARIANVKLMKGMPPPIDEQEELDLEPEEIEEDITEEDFERIEALIAEIKEVKEVKPKVKPKIKLSPTQTKQLKNKRKSELEDLGIAFPENASLQVLNKLLSESQE